MRTQLIKSTVFFQQLLSSRFRTLKERVVKTIMLLSVIYLVSITRIKCRMRYLYRKRAYIDT